MKKKTVLMFSLLCALLLFAVSPVWGEAGSGDVLVIFKAEEGVKVTAASVTEGREAFRTASVAASLGGRVTASYAHLSEAGGASFVRIQSETETDEALIEKLRARPDVLAASSNYRFHLAATPNDPGYGEAWGLPAVKAPSAWDTATGSNSVYVAVLDSGIAYQHEDLAGNFETEGYSRNFSGNTAGDNNYDDYNKHGSHVAGIIGAVGNNGVGVTGINWKTKLISVRAFDASGASASDLSEVTAALDYIVQLLKDNPSLNLAAINMSLETYLPTSPSGMTKDVFHYAMKTLNDLNRCLIVVAAGNSGIEVGVPASSGNNKDKYVYPASLPDLSNMLVVAAVNSSLEIATAKDFSGGSNWSASNVHLAAPGVNILSTVRNNGYQTMTGTSMATPYVAGAAALLRSVFPSATTSQLRTALLEGATTRSGLSSYVAGGRLLNIDGAMKVLNSGKTPPTDAAAVKIDETASTKTSNGYSTVVVKISSGGISPQVGALFYVWLKQTTATNYVRYWTKVVTQGQLDISVSELKSMSEVSTAASISTGAYDILYQSADGTFSGKITDVQLAGENGGSGGSSGGGGCNAAVWPCGVLLALVWLKGKRARIR